MIDEEQLFGKFASAGFSNTHGLKRVTELQSRSNGRYLYLMKDALINNCIHLVIEEQLAGRPEWSKAGITIGERYHSSNLRGFDKRLHRGKKPIHFGVSVKLNNSALLLDFLHLFSRIPR